jgi:hypothetical protein
MVFRRTLRLVALAGLLALALTACGSGEASETPWSEPTTTVGPLAGVALQLSGTFLVLVLRPDVAFVGGNPLLLSVEGEYVVKNLVLLAATAALALHARSPRPDATANHQLPDAHDPAHSIRAQDAA